MKRMMKSGLLFLLISVCGVSFSFAGDRIQKRDRKKDGSCQQYIVNQDTGLTLAADQTRTKDRKKDGSCKLG